jgi:hypothetical protein
MDVAHKLVIRLPLESLWDEKGLLTATRRRTLTREDLKSLLQTTPVQFVVVEIGASPRWIPLEDRFRFWKQETKPHLADPGSHITLGNFPDNYCYFASEWEIGAEGTTVVVLERNH